MATFLWILGVAVVLFTVFGAFRFWRRTAAPRLVTCPETGDRHAVELDPARSLGQKLRGKDEMKLRECSRWPERADCDQPCREQIATAPDGCRVRALLDEFYAHKSCVLCGKEFGDAIDWYQHEPGFISPDHHVMTWQDIPSEKLPEIMEDHHPVCWDCKVIEVVRQKHPRLITDRLAH
jgi:hypothetical protein